MAIWLFAHSGVFGLALALLEVEANLIGATAHALCTLCRDDDAELGTT